MKGVIVCYILGIVHLRNLRYIAKSMPDWTFRIIYEPGSTVDTQELAEVPFEKMPFEKHQVPAAVMSGDIRAILLFVMHLRPEPLNLLKYGLEHNIPTIAIEESNQMAMNKYLMNSHRNYIYPAHHVLAASEYEKSELIEMGVPGRRISVSGWPFYSGPVGKIGPLKQRQTKKSLGLDPDRPVAVLALNGLGYADENLESLRKQLDLSARGLPEKYQLVIKPHPLEKMDIIRPFVKKYAPRAIVFDGTIPSSKVLEGADILLSRGVSQVVLEALHQELPVVVLSTGIKTPFHGSVDEVIIKGPQDLTDLLTRLESEPDPMKLYADFHKKHIPLLPKEACEQACRRIEEIATDRILDAEPEQMWLELGLYQAFRIDRKQALDSLSVDRTKNLRETRTALIDLIRYQATRTQLQILKDWAGNTFRSQALRCLWIDQLYHNRQQVTDNDLNWLRGFPPPECFTYFMHHTSLWLDILLRSAQVEVLEGLTRNLDEIYGYVPEIARFLKQVDCYNKNFSGRIQYKIRWVAGQMRYSLRYANWALWLKGKMQPYLVSENSKRKK